MSPFIIYSSETVLKTRFLSKDSVHITYTDPNNTVWLPSNLSDLSKTGEVQVSSVKNGFKINVVNPRNVMINQPQFDLGEVFPKLSHVTEVKLYEYAGQVHVFYRDKLMQLATPKNTDQLGTDVVIKTIDYGFMVIIRNPVERLLKAVPQSKTEQWLKLKQDYALAYNNLLSIYKKEAEKIRVECSQQVRQVSLEGLVLSPDSSELDAFEHWYSKMDHYEKMYESLKGITKEQLIGAIYDSL